MQHLTRAKNTATLFCKSAFVQSKHCLCLLDFLPACVRAGLLAGAIFGLAPTTKAPFNCFPKRVPNTSFSNAPPRCCLSDARSGSLPNRNPGVLTTDRVCVNMRIWMHKSPYCRWFSFGVPPSTNLKRATYPSLISSPDLGDVVDHLLVVGQELWGVP